MIIALGLDFHVDGLDRWMDGLEVSSMRLFERKNHASYRFTD